MGLSFTDRWAKLEYRCTIHYLLFVRFDLLSTGPLFLNRIELRLGDISMFLTFVLFDLRVEDVVQLIESC